MIADVAVGSNLTVNFIMDTVKSSHYKDFVYYVGRSPHGRLLLFWGVLAFFGDAFVLRSALSGWMHRRSLLPSPCGTNTYL